MVPLQFLYCLFVSLMNLLMAQFGAKQFLEQLSCFWIRGKSIINYYETEHAE